MILPRPKQKTYLREEIKEDKNLINLIQIVILITINEFEKGIPWELQLKAQNRFTICKILKYN